MSQDQKRDMACELLRITGAADPPDFGSQSNAHADMIENYTKLQLDALTDLYVEHFTREQLQSQLDYYRSEIGQSILRVQSDINKQYPQMLTKISEQLNEHSRKLQDNVAGEFRLETTNAAKSGNDDVYQSFKLPAHWSIRVTTRSGNPAGLNVAIGFDCTLKMIETKTPFEYEFVANHYTALMTLTGSGEEISAEVWSDVDGEFRKKGGGSGGLTHKSTFSPHGPLYSSSGSAL